MTRLKADERRGLIMEAARRAFALKGFKAATVKDIAGEAGVSEALLFRHFPTKAAMLSSIVDSLGMASSGARREPPASADDFFRALESFEEEFLAAAEGNASLLRLVLYAVLEDVPLPPEFDLTCEGGFNRWFLDCVDRGKAEWGFPDSPAGFESLCSFMGGLVYYALQVSVIGSGRGPEARGSFTALLRLALDGGSHGAI